MLTGKQSAKMNRDKSVQECDATKA